MATFFLRFFIVLSIVFLAGAALKSPGSDTQEQAMSRPRDPWVFAGSLDDRPRILFVALHHDLWVAYDMQLGDVYKAWRGALTPPVDNSLAFSPWPASIDGLTYFSRSNSNPWRIIRNGVSSTPEVHYKGYRLAGDRLTVRYQLKTEYGHSIDVEESPEVVHNAEERPGLQREFFVDRVPDGFQVAIDVEATTLKKRDDVQADGILQRKGAKTHDFVWGKTFDLLGRLILTPGEATTLTTYFAPNLLKNLINDAALDPLELFKHTKVYQSLDLGDEASASSRLIRRQDHVPGVAVKVYGIGESIDSLMQLAPGQLPTSHTVEPAIDLTSRNHFGNLDFYFITHVSGFLNIASEGNYSFQILADDGVRFAIANQVLYEHNGLQPAEPSSEINIDLKPGVYPFSIEHFQSTGQKRLTLNWKPPWLNEFEVIRAPTISTKKEEQRRFSAGKKHVLRQFPDALIELEQLEIDALHPGLKIRSLEVEGVKGVVGGMDFLSDGRLAIATWDGSGTVYVVDGLAESDMQIGAQIVAKGLAFPFGIKAIDDELFVLQKHELTQLIDLDGDALIDEYRVVANDWPLTNDFDEWAFGLVYREGQFYSGLGMPVDADGAILIENIPHRGHLVRLGFDGSVEKIASGFQIPNGLVIDESGALAVVDHRNPWFSDSRLMLALHNERQAFQPSLASQASPLQMSSIWLPSGSKSEAPTQPIRVNTGAYEGQWIYGDLNAGMLNRVFVEEINGIIQGAVFRLTEGMETPVSRLAIAPDGALIAGAVAFDSPWKIMKEGSFILQHISFTDTSVFEMKAIRAKREGFEIEFSNPVDATQAEDPSMYRIYQWSNNESGHPRRRDRSIVVEAEVKDVQVLQDGRRVLVELARLESDKIYYINLDPAFQNERGATLWSNESWYTLNDLPEMAVGTANED